MSYQLIRPGAFDLVHDLSAILYAMTHGESDRLERLARIVAIATEYLGDHEAAMRWLKRPNRALGGISPLTAIDTELGARQVENILGRIAHGGVS